MKEKTSPESREVSWNTLLSNIGSILSIRGKCEEVKISTEQGANPNINYSHIDIFTLVPLKEIKKDFPEWENPDPIKYLEKALSAHYPTEVRRDSSGEIHVQRAL